MLTVEYDGFTHKISDWHPEAGGTAMVCLNSVYLDDVKICTVPGVMTTKEWNNGSPNPELLQALYKNLVESGTFCAKEKLGML